MSPEAGRADEAREWLSKVASDLRGARIDLAAEPPSSKALKAFLAWNDRPFRKTHSLEELAASAAPSTPESKRS